MVLLPFLSIQNVGNNFINFFLTQPFFLYCDRKKNVMAKLLWFAFLFIFFQGIAQEKYSLLSIPPQLMENANSVLLDELVETDVTDASKMSVKTHRVVAVLNKNGENNVGAYLNYDDQTRVKDLEAYIYDAFGDEIKHFKKKDFTDVSGVDGYSMYLDDRKLYMAYTPTTFPFIVVFNSEVETGDSAFLDRWYPVGGYGRSTKKSVAKIKFSSTNKPRFKAHNIEGYDITLEKSTTEIICKAENILPIKYEELSHSFSQLAPNVQFALNSFYLKGTIGNGSNWSQFGSWMDRTLLSNISELNPATITRVKNLTANETTNEGKARKVYQYLQDKVRYVSVQIGIGGWKPMLASDVDNLAYGDCKALTNYTKALLEAVGVPSYYTIISAGEYERDITEDFTAMQGNHAILALPNENSFTWLECTSQDTPFGYLGNFTDDRDAMIVTPEGGKIVHTQVYPTADNLQIATANVMLQASGAVSAKFKRVSQGLEYDGLFMLPKQKKDIIEGFYKNEWSYLNGITLENINFENNRDDIIFTENLNIKLSSYASLVNDGLLFCPNTFAVVQDIPPRILDRKHDLFLSEGYVHREILNINIPADFIASQLPEDIILDSKFGNYSVKYSLIDPHTINYERELRIEKGTYPPGDYELYRNFKREVSRLDRTKILLTPIE